MEIAAWLLKLASLVVWALQWVICTDASDVTYPRFWDGSTDSLPLPVSAKRGLTAHLPRNVS